MINALYLTVWSPVSSLLDNALIAFSPKGAFLTKGAHYYQLVLGAHVSLFVMFEHCVAFERARMKK